MTTGGLLGVGGSDASQVGTVMLQESVVMNVHQGERMASKFIIGAGKRDFHQPAQGDMCNRGGGVGGEYGATDKCEKTTGICMGMRGGKSKM